MKKEKIFVIVPIVIIVTLLGVIGYQLAKSQFSKSSSNSDSPTAPRHSIGDGGQGSGGQGQAKGVAPGGGSLQQQR
jgi:hypothetical protein